MTGSHALLGDDGVQLAQDRRGDRGLRLGRRQPVVLPGGEVSVAGGGHPFGLQAPPATRRSAVAAVRRR
jgi:hypothetical protein